MTHGSEAARSALLMDTHTLVWSMNDNPKLGTLAKETIRAAYREDRVQISAITPWEIALLVSKGRLALNKDVLSWMNEALAIPGSSLVQLEPEIAIESTRLAFEMHADPADRILVATARQMGATLVTADRALLELAGRGHFVALDAAV